MPHQDNFRVRYDRIAILAAMIAASIAITSTWSAHRTYQALSAPTAAATPSPSATIDEGFYVPADAIFELDYDETLLESWRQVAREVEVERGEAERAAAEARRREVAARERERVSPPPSGETPNPEPTPEVPKPEKPKSDPEPGGGSIKDYASELVGGGKQFECLDLLWQRESGWDHTATNPTSGAYGIPQAYPGKKMASAGADWRTNPRTQVKWGVGYITERYGSPCEAWEHSERKGWY